jgi:hypothetical protein
MSSDASVNWRGFAAAWDSLAQQSEALAVGQRIFNATVEENPRLAAMIAYRRTLH